MSLKAYGANCHLCPARDGQTCPFAVWHAGCPAEQSTTDKGREWHLASARRQLDFQGPQPDVPLADLILVETCPYRWSSCGCTSKPAACERESLPMPTTLEICRECRLEPGGTALNGENWIK